MPDLDFFEGAEIFDPSALGYTNRYQEAVFGGGGSNAWGGAFGKFGSRGIRADNSGGAANMYFVRAIDKDGNALAFTEYVQQIHFFYNDTMSSSKMIMGVGEMSAGVFATRHLELFVGAGGVASNLDLLVCRNGTTLTTCTGVLLTGQYNFIEIIGKVHDTTGYYHVRVNGTVVATVTGADTRNAGTGTCSAHWFGNFQLTGNFDLRYDDYAFSLNPSSSGDYLGDGHEVGLIPNAAGN